MDNLQLRLPEPLNCETRNLHVNWTKFHNQFKNLIKANGYNKKNDDVKVALLLNLVGDEGNEIYESFNLNDDEKENYEKVIDAFEKYCIKKKNIIYERHCFYSRMQKEGELFDSFMKDVKILAKTCEFGDQKDSLIRDRIIFGIRDLALQEKLIKNGDPSLIKTIDECRLAEQTRHHASEIQQTAEINFIKSKGMSQNFSSKHIKENRNEKQAQNYIAEIIKCTRCNFNHAVRKCPAYGKKCLKCQGMNHFAKCCKSKNINNIDSSTNPEYEDACIDSVKLDNKLNPELDEEKCNIFSNNDFYISSIDTFPIVSKKILNNNYCWVEKLKLENEDNEITFKLDSGSDVNILPMKFFSKLKLKNKKMNKSHMRLRAYGGSQLLPLGCVTLNVIVQNVKYMESFVVIDSDSVPILGLASCVRLGLINRIHTISYDMKLTEKDKFMKFNKELFEGLGKFPEKLKLSVKPDHKPITRPPRRIPIAIRNKVKNALDNLESKKIIEKLNEPVDWISNLVVNEKPNGSLRLCLDPQFLNEALKKITT